MSNVLFQHFLSKMMKSSVSRLHKAAMHRGSLLPCRHASRLVFKEYGTPSEVVQLEHFPDPSEDSVQPNQVVVRMLRAAINPADVNTISGMYPIRPDLPAVGGGDGVGEVRAVGRHVENLKIGDWVIPSRNMDGTWTTHMMQEERHLLKIRNDIPIETAATIRINPPSAYQMLRQFVQLSPGDVVVQNGANSGVGEAVIQMARKMGLVSVNIVRDRDGIEELKSYLKELGADHVWTEEEHRKSRAFQEGAVERPRLALNCVGGASSTELIKSLCKGGVHVTYGGMSLKPVTVPTSALIFKDVSVRGYWLSRNINEAPDSPERFQMYDFLSAMAKSGELRAPRHRLVKLKNYKTALEDSMKGFKDGKLIFDLT